MRLTPFVIMIALLAACEKKTEAPSTTTPEPTGGPPGPATAADAGNADRPQLTSAECEAQGGKVVGDIGDGAIHRPDYTCESGSPPIGTITPDPGGPVAVEGSVCCK
jgi:hypothetical protein